jgi:hypothetical protein
MEEIRTVDQAWQIVRREMIRLGFPLTKVTHEVIRASIRCRPLKAALYFIADEGFARMARETVVDPWGGASRRG